MVTRFFKKEGATTLQLPNGIVLPFEKVDRNWSIVGTKTPELLTGIETAILQGKGGVTEITPEEFAELRKKKEGKNSKKLWREEFAPRMAAATMAAARQRGPATSVAPASNAAGTSPALIPEQRPTASKR